ncbi:LysE family transporter [Flavobacterium sp. 20NA77.7]|jgi:threonine/homoserine/homoserine lactone efflux protein|uniref:LysE family transporter n=1 Tax=Flavobacterium nakdongensis TaxID=3073563 RepID=A0ABY9RB30_9FLAO|nr:LysE family transporter [Flavobacterium sp. 20NA77.7]WMW77859.1 LysE family transporter [Flavobacterium sp. 20NA77.7]
MIKDIFVAIPWAFLLAFSIGPGFFVLLETSITKGFKAAFTFDCGIVFSDIVFILIAYFASNQILAQFKDNPNLFIIGGLVMAIYGIVSFIQLKKKFVIEIENDEVEDIPKNNYLGLFFKGFFLNVINIGILGFWMMVIITQGPQLEMKPFRIFTFFASTLLFYLGIDVVKIILAKQLKHKLTPTNIYKIKRVISFILIIFGVFFLLQGVFPGMKDDITNKIEHTTE